MLTDNEIRKFDSPKNWPQKRLLLTDRGGLALDVELVGQSRRCAHACAEAGCDGSDVLTCCETIFRAGRRTPVFPWMRPFAFQAALLRAVDEAKSLS